MSNTVAYEVVTLTKEQASDLYKTDWWSNLDVEQAAKRQLFTNEMIMPFDMFYHGLKQLMKRDVNRAEVLFFEDLRNEYLGLKVKPEYAEVMAKVDAMVESGLDPNEPMESAGIKTNVVLEVPDERD